MIPLFKVNMAEDAPNEAFATLKSGMIGEGPKVEEFTEALKVLFNNPNTVALNSCTSALTLALRLANVQPNQKVISSPFTFPATNCAIKTTGAKIIWANVDSRTMSMDLTMATDLILKHTDTIGAVVITLVGGIPPYHLEAFMKLTRQYGIPVIVDAAHGLLTTLQGDHISNWVDFCCFSFQSIKHLTTVDGGALTMSDNWMLDRAERLKWFGMSRKIPEGTSRLAHQMNYSIPEWGYKFHMNDVSAAIGLANLVVAQQAVLKSRQNAMLYQSDLFLIDNQGLSIFTPPPDSNPSWWVYGFHVYSSERNNMITHLAANDISSSPLWKMNFEHSCFPDDDNRSSIPTPIFIPNGYWVTPSDQKCIVENIKETP